MGSFDGMIEIAILENYVGRFAPELQCYALQVGLRSCRHDQMANLSVKSLNQSYENKDGQNENRTSVDPVKATLSMD